MNGTNFTFINILAFYTLESPSIQPKSFESKNEISINPYFSLSEALIVETLTKIIRHYLSFSPPSLLTSHHWTNSSEKNFEKVWLFCPRPLKHSNLGLQRSGSDRPTVDWETLFEAAPISHPEGTFGLNQLSKKSPIFYAEISRRTFCFFLSKKLLGFSRANGTKSPRGKIKGKISHW